MAEEVIKPYGDVEWVWISNYYDMNLSGLCREEGKLCSFEADYDSDLVHIYSLGWLEKITWLFKKKLFEWCVGYHWTYKDGERMGQFERGSLLKQLCFRIYYKVK